MKVELITYSRARNYGGILQAYALYRVIAGMGADVEFVDYIMPRSNIFDKQGYTDRAVKMSKVWGRNRLTKWIWGRCVYPKICSDYQVFYNFIEKRAAFSSRYFSEEELRSSPPKADLYLSGSDQIWNDQFTGTGLPDPVFFWGFLPQGKKLSYASSFGKEQIADSSLNMIEPLLKQYTHVSVREDSGKEILQKIGIDSTVVLDPTMLCEREVWEEICAERQTGSPYLFFYQIQFDAGLFQMAERLSRQLGVKLITVTLNRNDVRRIKGKVLVVPSVETWLSYIRYADVIVTDSFHAAVFSVLFRKKFMVYTGTRKEMATRITTLLQLLHIEQLEMVDFDVRKAAKIAASDLDWGRISVLLEREKQVSMEWLKNAMRECADGRQSKPER